MTKRRIIILTFIVSIIVISNILSGYINIFTEGLFKSYLYQTENAEFEFRTIPSKGRDVEMMERQFSNIKKENPEYKNLQLYRTFKRSPLKFWNWYNYLTDERYDYSFKEKLEFALDNPLNLENIESAIIEVGPNFRVTDSLDIARSLPFEYLEQITNEMNISKNDGLTKFLPKYKLTITLKNGQSRTFRMTENTFKENSDWTYRFQTENYTDTIWRIGYKP